MSTATLTRPARTVGNVAKDSRQVALLKDLITELREFDNTSADATRAGLNRAWENNSADRDFLSCAITNLIGKLKEHRAARTRKATPARTKLPEVPAGRYAVENSEGELRFYKVEEDGGFFKVFVQASDELHQLRFAAFREVLVKIEEVGPLQASIRYGQAIGVCGKCGRTLTDPESRAAGIGPICAGKLGA